MTKAHKMQTQDAALSVKWRWPIWLHNTNNAYVNMDIMTDLFYSNDVIAFVSSRHKKISKQWHRLSRGPDGNEIGSMV